MAIDALETRRQRALSAFSSSASRTWTQGQFTVTIANPQVRPLNRQRVFSVEVTVDRNGIVLFDDRVNIPNPPTAIRGALNADGTSQLSDSPLQAIRNTLFDVVRITTQNLTVPRLERNADGTFNGDTLAVRSGTNDGRVTSTDASWNTCRDGASLVANTTNTSQTISANPTYSIVQGFIDFDTSSIGAGATVSSYTFTLYGTGSAETDTDGTTIDVRSYDWGGTVTTADYRDTNPGSNWTGLTLFASKVTNTWNQTNNTANDFTSGAGTITKGGTTSVVVGIDRIASASAPTGNNQFITYFADQAGTSSDPLLTVTYTTPGIPPFLIRRPKQHWSGLRR